LGVGEIKGEDGGVRRKIGEARPGCAGWIERINRVGDAQACGFTGATEDDQIENLAGGGQAGGEGRSRAATVLAAEQAAVRAREAGVDDQRAIGMDEEEVDVLSGALG